MVKSEAYASNRGSASRSAVPRRLAGMHIHTPIGILCILTFSTIDTDEWKPKVFQSGCTSSISWWKGSSMCGAQLSNYRNVTIYEGPFSIHPGKRQVHTCPIMRISLNEAHIVAAGVSKHEAYRQVGEGSGRLYVVYRISPQYIRSRVQLV